MLSLLALATLFMGYKTQFAEMSYEFGKILPNDDPAMIDSQKFKERFGDDGNVCVIAIQTENMFELSLFNAWYDLSQKLEKIDGVNETIALSQIHKLEKNDSLKRFDFKKVINKKPESQKELDSLKAELLKLPFYEGMLYNSSTNAYLMAIVLDKKIVNSAKRVGVVNDVMELSKSFSKLNDIEVYSSGLPLIRTLISSRVKNEMKMFVMLAILVTSLILFYFFKSFRAVFFSMLVVITGVVWSVGSLGILGFKITLLTALIPPLVIVIGIPNCIFLLNKYFSEYRLHGNKIKALSRVIQKTGNAILMTNATTSIGFITFAITKSDLLREFGIVASLNIMFVFILSLLIIPIVYSFLPSPKERHTSHLDRVWVVKAVNLLEYIVKFHRIKVYVATSIIVGIAFYGMTLLKSTGNIVDDVPRTDKIYTDLKFFEKHFKGIMPFELMIDTKKKKGALKSSTLKKLNKLQNKLIEYPEFSKPLSIAEVAKFSKQAYYNGSPSMYKLPNNQEKAFIFKYAKNSGGKNNSMLESFMDSTNQITRLSVQMADIGTIQMDSVMNKLKPQIDAIFPPEKYDVILTGTSYTFLKGTKYLVKNLFISVMLAIVFIAFIMALMFRSFKMVVVSLIPNLIPLLITSALMGYFGIALKPSTLLVFSIAFGISIDDTIHFLAKYRQELKLTPWDLKGAVLRSLHETGISMIYTSIVLFFGFGIFVASDFGGTQALGILVSLTLLFAMLSNLVLLPSFLLTLEKKLVTQAFKEPFIELDFDEDEFDSADLPSIKKNNNE